MLSEAQSISIFTPIEKRTVHLDDSSGLVNAIRPRLESESDEPFNYDDCIAKDAMDKLHTILTESIGKGKLPPN